MQLQKITPCLWFNGQAEEAVNFYLSVFKNAKRGDITYYTEAGKDIHGMEPGAPLTIEFELNGQTFTALNGDTTFKFTEAVSFQVFCDTQEEIDYYWNQLSQDGDPAAQQCGWLKDKFGLSWQIVPSQMAQWLSNPAKAEKVMATFMPMKKIDIATLERAYNQG